MSTRLKKFKHDHLPPHLCGTRETNYHDGRIHVFADGASKHAAGRVYGGWATVLRFADHVREYSGNEVGASNNRMELMAIREGMKSLHRKVHKRKAIITSDSQYSIQAIVVWTPQWLQNGWTTGSGKTASNRELLEEINDLKRSWMSFKWVKGHAGHTDNERCDVLATEARKQLEDFYTAYPETECVRQIWRQRGQANGASAARS